MNQQSSIVLFFDLSAGPLALATQFFYTTTKMMKYLNKKQVMHNMIIPRNHIHYVIHMNKIKKIATKRLNINKRFISSTSTSTSTSNCVPTS